MNVDPVAQLLALKVDGTRELAMIAVLKKTFQMQDALLEVLDRSPPAPAGQGRVVDKRA